MLIGKTALGKYRLLRSLGIGSNAEVFLAQPIQFPEYRVVVKRIHDAVVTHPQFRQLFEAEVQSLATFDHPYAVGLVEASLDDPIGPCLVMEYVPGLTLEQLIAKHRRLDPARAGRLLGCLCHALQTAHDSGIIHRDLKPANLMVMNPDRPDETLKVMDFGFAGFTARPHIQIAELTGVGAIYAMGTPAYVSPEMIRGDTVDTRSDLYSVGVILYEMLTGRLPFTWERVERLLAAHVRDNPPRFHKIGCSFLSTGLDSVVQLALSKFPNERQQTAREVAETYGRAIGENVWAATAPVGWMPVPVERTPPPRLQTRERPRQVDPFHVLHEFEAVVPERMAAAKLRGFVEDLGGEVLASEPGVIRLRVGLPKGVREGKVKAGGFFGWLSRARKPSVPRGYEPVEVELQMDKPDPRGPRLHVIAAFRPMKEYPPVDRYEWHERCDQLNAILRQYLGA